jgi:DNA-binding beta-propeller fold protein YncE
MEWGEEGGSASKRARAPGLDAVVSTATIPGLGLPNGLFVLSDGTRVVSTTEHTVVLVSPSGRLSTIAGHRNREDEEEQATLKDGQGVDARFSRPRSLTVDGKGDVIVLDKHNHALRRVGKVGAVVRTLAGNGEAGFTDGVGTSARFSFPTSVVLATNGDLIVSDFGNHAIRIVTGEGEVRTLVGNGEAGFVDGRGAEARFRWPRGLALDREGNLVVADCGNHAIRFVTMAGVVTTLVGNGSAGFADGAYAVALFNAPTDVVVDGEDMIVVADKNNHRIRKLAEGQVTTLVGSSESGTTDGAGASVRFDRPIRLALDERGRILVVEAAREDTVRVVEALPPLAPPRWMGPAEEGATRVDEATAATLAALQHDYGKLVEDPGLADVVLVVEGERFPAHRNVLAARSEYFRGLLLSGMQEGRAGAGGALQEIEVGEVSAGAFRVVLRYLYTGEVPEWMQGAAAVVKGRSLLGVKENGKCASVGDRCGASQWNESQVDYAREGADKMALGREVLKAADLFQAEGLLKHCLEAFRSSLTARTAIEQLVWAHHQGPEEAHRAAISYVELHRKTIQVISLRTHASCLNDACERLSASALACLCVCVRTCEMLCATRVRGGRGACPTQ